MAQFIKHFVQDLDQDLKVRQCGTIVFNADDLSNVIEVDLYHGETPAELSGSVVGAVICSDGSTVPITGGTISGNTVSITLTGDCFAIPGPIGVGVQIVNGTEKTTVLKAVYNVELFTTDTVIDPGSRITLSVSDLISQIDTAVDSIPADYSDLLDSIAPTYSELTFPIEAGTVCWHEGNLYQATQEIASSETWTDAHWTSAVISEIMAGKDVVKYIAPEYNASDPEVWYMAGDTVSHDGKVYVCTSTQIIQGAFNPAYWQETDVYTAGKNAARKITDNLENTIAPEFDRMLAYSVGDYVYNGSTLYRFTSAHTSGNQWSSSEVEEVTVAGELKAGKSSLQTAVEDIEQDISDLENALETATVAETKTYLNIT